MALLSIQQAAKQIGIDRTTLYRHIKQGLVSATTAADGSRQIDTSELLRAYGDKLQKPRSAPGSATDARTKEHPGNATALQMELAGLRAQVEAQQTAIDTAAERIAELRERAQADQVERDRLLSIVERQSRLLESAPQKKRGFFEFFTG